MRFLLAAALLVWLVPATASAITVDEIVALSRGGVSDDVILALIERDQTVFAIDSEQVLSLKTNGVSDQVIVAMMWSGRQQAGSVAAPQAPAVTATPTPGTPQPGAFPNPSAVVVVPYPFLVTPTVPAHPRSRPTTPLQPAGAMLNPPPFISDPATGIFFRDRQAARGIFFNPPAR